MSCSTFVKLIISIHTPARGVTNMAATMNDNLQDFNPHSRKGSDTESVPIPDTPEISIHTPARGVTK